LRLERLVDGLLVMSQIRARRLEIQRQPLDLATLVREAVGRTVEEASRMSCRINLTTDGRVAGQWDPLRLDQVVTNLLSNAIKYGKGKPIEVTVRAEGDRAILTVRDHGIGIAEEDQRRIFEKFERAAPRPQQGGLGLGLYIARQIVEAHGGVIRVSSALHAGATFAVELPRNAQIDAGTLLEGSAPR
jgi:signal transduction histidine kinase